MTTTSSDQPPGYAAEGAPTGWKPKEDDNAPAPPQGDYSDYPAPSQQQIWFSGGYTRQRNESFDEHQMEEGDTAPFLFSDKRIRQGFVRKVFMILTAQLLVTTGICAVFYCVSDIRMFLYVNPWMYFVSYVIFLVTYICLVCCRSCSRTVPMNYIALTVLTLAMAYMVATITSFHEIESVMIAFGITVGLCVGLIFAWQTRIDFTMCSGLLFCFVIVLFMTGMTCWIWGLVAGWSQTIMIIYGGVGALVFSFFLICDVQSIIGGRKYDLSPEEYVYGAVQIYLDVAYIFLQILSIVSGLRSK